MSSNRTSRTVPPRPIRRDDRPTSPTASTPGSLENGVQPVVCATPEPPMRRTPTRTTRRRRACGMAGFRERAKNGRADRCSGVATIYRDQGPRVRRTASQAAKTPSFSALRSAQPMRPIARKASIRSAIEASSADRIPSRPKAPMVKLAMIVPQARDSWIASKSVRPVRAR